MRFSIDLLIMKSNWSLNGFSSLKAPLEAPGADDNEHVASGGGGELPAPGGGGRRPLPLMVGRTVVCFTPGLPVRGRRRQRNSRVRYC